MEQRDAKPKKKKENKEDFRWIEFMVLLIMTQVFCKKHLNRPNEPVKRFYWMRKLQSICNMSPATLRIDFLQLLPFFSGFFFSLGAGLWPAAAAGAGEAEGADGWGGGAGFETHSATASPAGMGTHTAGENRGDNN